MRRRRPLTGTEADVVRLAAEGRSNEEIALELGIGRRTVETHLLRAYRKLGVSDRGALAAYVGSEGPEDEPVDPLRPHERSVNHSDTGCN
jgi:DNA-binding CsgD family transcriptional regulator